MTELPSSDSTPPLSPPAPPVWARACDLLCLGLVILAVLVVRFGGFHLHAAGVRLGLTSPSRLLFWAIAIGLVRHVAAPAMPIHRDLQRRLADWKRSESYSRFMVPDATVGSNDATLRPGLRSIALLTLLLFTVLTAVMTYPQLVHMGDSVSDAGDPLLNLW